LTRINQSVLLRFVIDEQHFFEFDSVTTQQELEAEKNRTGRMKRVRDGVTTVIRIQTAERDHKAEHFVRRSICRRGWDYHFLQSIIDFLQ